MKNLFKLLIILSLVITSLLLAQNPNGAEEKKLLDAISFADRALIAYNKDLLLQARDIFEKENNNLTCLYYQTFCEYKLLEMSTRPGNGNLFDNYYDKAVANAEKLSSIEGYESEGKTLLAGIYMMKIASNPMAAVSLTPKIHSLLDEAQSNNSSNPRSYIIRGIMKLQTPAVFGGSNEDAAKNFAKAIQLFEKEDDVNPLLPHWGYLESLVWMGRTQEKLENYDAAKFSYQKVLNIEPEYGWVKYSLLPALIKKMENK